MTWEVPDRSEDHHPEGGCSCGRDLADAADGAAAAQVREEGITPTLPTPNPAVAPPSKPR
jgi:hypothetical protein